MEPLNLSALLTFVFVTTFTPGPNNITSSSMGILYGYRATVRYLLGIVVGFFGIMALSGLVSRTLYQVFPALESTMRIVGAAYILWLAYKTFRMSYAFEGEAPPALGFRDGFLLQIVNPKVWVYGLTLYVTFLSSITGSVVLLLVSAILLAGVAFSAISTWTLTGALIKRVLRRPGVQRAINTVLTLLLVYTAIELSGLL